MDGTGVPGNSRAGISRFSPDGGGSCSARTGFRTQGVGLPDGTDAHAVTDSVAGEVKWLSGSFSPDGLYITNGRAPILNGQQQNADVYIMRLDGSDLRDVTDDPNFWDSAPDWGPAP
jgi:hypothetical protein